MSNYSRANHLARCKKHHQSTSAPVNARTNYAAKDRDRPARPQNTRHSLGPPGAASQESSGPSSHPATLIIGSRHSHFPRAQIMSQNTCLTSLATPLTYFTIRKKEYIQVYLCFSSLLTMTLTNWQSGIHIISRGIKVGKTKKLSRPSLRKWLSFF